MPGGSCRAIEAGYMYITKRVTREIHTGQLRGVAIVEIERRAYQNSKMSRHIIARSAQAQQPDRRRVSRPLGRCNGCAMYHVRAARSNVSLDSSRSFDSKHTPRRLTRHDSDRTRLSRNSLFHLTNLFTHKIKLKVESIKIKLNKRFLKLSRFTTILCSRDSRDRNLRQFALRVSRCC